MLTAIKAWLRHRVVAGAAWVERRWLELAYWLGPTGSRKWVASVEDLWRVATAALVTGSLATGLQALLAFADAVRPVLGDLLDGDLSLRLSAAVTALTALGELLRRLGQHPPDTPPAPLIPPPGPPAEPSPEVIDVHSL